MQEGTPRFKREPLTANVTARKRSRDSLPFTVCGATRKLGAKSLLSNFLLFEAVSF